MKSRIDDEAWVRKIRQQWIDHLVQDVKDFGADNIQVVGYTKRCLDEYNREIKEIERESAKQSSQEGI